MTEIFSADELEKAAREYENYDQSQPETEQAESAGRYNGFRHGVKWCIEKLLEHRHEALTQFAKAQDLSLDEAIDLLLKSYQEWIPVERREPGNGEIVVGYLTYNNYTWQDFLTTEDIDWQFVTHWKPQQEGLFPKTEKE